MAGRGRGEVAEVWLLQWSDFDDEEDGEAEMWLGEEVERRIVQADDARSEEE